MRHQPQHSCGVHDLHVALLRATSSPAATLATATAAHAAALRKAGRLAPAMHHHLELHAFLRGEAAGGAAAAGDAVPAAPPPAAIAAWRLEEAKLLWASGRQQLAMKLVESLPGDLDNVAPGASHAHAVHAEHASTSHQPALGLPCVSLANEWVLVTRFCLSYTLLTALCNAFAACTRAHPLPGRCILTSGQGHLARLCPVLVSFCADASRLLGYAAADG